MSQPAGTVAIFNEQLGWSLPASIVERWQERAGDRIMLRQATSRNALDPLLADASCLIGLPIGAIASPEALPASVRWIQLTESAGSAAPLIAELIDRGVRVTSAAGIRAPQLAEHAMALLLMLTRRLHLAAARQAEHDWANHAIGQQVGTLAGQRVLLMAPASVGQFIAQRLKVFDARVIATRNDPLSPYPHVDELYGPLQLDEILPTVDALVACLPRLRDSAFALDAKRLRKLRSHAVVVDLSRGGAIDHDALLVALRRGRLAAAGLDAMPAEPLPPTSPFWTMPNVVVTPHIGAASPRYWKQAGDIVANNIDRFLSDEPLTDEIRPGHASDAAVA